MTEAGQPAELRHVVLGMLLFMLPFEVHRALLEYPGEATGFSRFVSLGLFDVALLAFVLLALLSLRKRLQRPVGIAAWMAIGLLIATVATLPFHGSWRGVALLVRLIGTVLIALEISVMGRGDIRVFVIGPLVAAAAVQGALALGQALEGGPLGLPGEPAEFGAVADTVRPAGTTSHPYLLSTYSLVAVAAGVMSWRRPTPRWWLVALAFGAIPIGLSFSRAAVVSVVFVAIGWSIAVVKHPRTYAAPVVAAVAGIVIPALVFVPAWLERVEDSTTGTLNDASANRVELTNQAVDMIVDHPIVGVGPWRYTLVAEEDYPLESGFDSPVHSLPFLVPAELGVLAGLAFAAMLIALGVRAVRNGPLVFALFGSVLGFTLFDVVLYWYPAGLVLFGAWLGLLDRAALDSAPASSSLTTETTEPVEP